MCSIKIRKSDSDDNTTAKKRIKHLHEASSQKQRKNFRILTDSSDDTEELKSSPKKTKPKANHFKETLMLSKRGKYIDTSFRSRRRSRQLSSDDDDDAVEKKEMNKEDLPKAKFMLHYSDSEKVNEKKRKINGNHGKSTKQKRVKIKSKYRREKRTHRELSKLKSKNKQTNMDKSKPVLDKLVLPCDEALSASNDEKEVSKAKNTTGDVSPNEVKLNLHKPYCRVIEPKKFINNTDFNTDSVYEEHDITADTSLNCEFLEKPNGVPSESKKNRNKITLLTSHDTQSMMEETTSQWSDSEEYGYKDETHEPNSSTNVQKRIDNVNNSDSKVELEDAKDAGDLTEGILNDLKETYKILANEIDSLQSPCDESFNSSDATYETTHFGANPGSKEYLHMEQINSENCIHENSSTDLLITKQKDVSDEASESGLTTVAKEADDQEEGEILSSSSEFNNGFSDEFVGNANDHHWLNQMAEQKPEYLILKCTQQSKNMLKSWDLKSKFHQRQNHQDFNKKRSQKRKASMEQRRSNDERCNAMAKLIEQRNYRFKRAEEECETNEKIEELPDVCKRKTRVKLKASEIYSDDSGSSCSSDEDSSKSNGGQIGPNVAKPESISVSTVVELNQMRISRNELARIAYFPIFKATVLNCFVRIYIGTHVGKPVHRIAEVIDVLERVTVYKLESTISNCYLHLKHGVQIRAFSMDKISNQAFTDSEFRMWQDSCEKEEVPPPTLLELSEKSKQLKAASHYDMTEDDINEMIEKKNKLRKRPINASLHKACLLKERDAAILNGDLEHAKIMEKRLNEIRARDLRNPIPKSCVVNFINQRNRMINMIDKCDDPYTQANDPFTRRSTKPCIVASSKRRVAEKMQSVESTLPAVAKSSKVKKPPSYNDDAEHAPMAKSDIIRHVDPNLEKGKCMDFKSAIEQFNESSPALVTASYIDVRERLQIPTLRDEESAEPSNSKRITLSDYWKKRLG